MKKYFVFIAIFSLFNLSSFSQYCPNSDFSMMNFTNWQGYTGSNNGLGGACCSTPGIVNGRHTIISTNTTDPNTCGGLTVPPVGETVCARLGNANIGAEAEQLVYTFTVDPVNPIFIYRYAVVLQDPGHPLTDQPFFSIRVLDANNNLVDSVCGLYEVYSTAGIPGFQVCNVWGIVNWKDWTSVGINLSSYIGQTLRIEFTTYDCSWGGHFGYAYLMAECGAMTIDITYCPGNDSVILSAPSGFSYQWNTGETTQSITIHNPLIGSLYTCNVTSVTGCGFSLQATISQTLVYPGFTFTNDSCSRTVSFTDTSYASNSSISMWHWDFGDSTNSNLANPTHVYPGQGTYIVTLDVSTQGGCDSSVTDTVIIGNVPYALFSTNDTCAPANVIFHNNSQIHDSIIAWSWNFGDGSPADTVNWNASHMYNTQGLYPVTLYVTYYNGCSDSMTYNLDIFPVPFADFTFITPLCEGYPTTITFTGLSSPWTNFNWNFDGGTIINGDSLGPYLVSWANNGAHTISLQLTDSICGSTSDTVKTVFVYSAPVASVSSDTVICQGDSVALFASGGSNYYWLPSEGLSASNIANPIASPSSTITYSVTVSDTMGCYATENVQITVLDTPSISFYISSPQICEGSNVTIIYTGNASPLASYNWNFSGGNIIAGSGRGPYIVNWSNNGNYYIYLSVTEPICGSSYDSIPITVNSLPSADAGQNDTICFGESINLSASGGILYHWYPSSGLNNAYIPAPTASPFFTTTYTVVVTNNGCTASDIVTVFVVQDPPAFAGNDTDICIGQSIQLSSSGGTGYSWSPSAGLNAANIFNPIATPMSSTTYTVTVSTPEGCFATDNISIQVNIPPTSSFNVSNNTLCSGNSINVFYTGNGLSGDVYIWDFNGGIVTSGSGSGPYTINFPVSGIYNISLSVEGICTSNVTTVPVTVAPVPMAYAGANVSICLGQDANLQASGGTTYLWSPSTGLSATNIANPIASPLQTTTYTVTVTLGACTATDDIIVIVTPLYPASAGNDVNLCLGDSVILNATGGTYYQWTPSTWLSSSTVSNPFAFPQNTTTYTVTITDVNGCYTTDNVNVFVYGVPTASFFVNPVIACTDNNVWVNYTGNASAWATYNWNFNGAAIISGSGQGPYYINWLSPGNYTITLNVVQNNCPSSDMTVSVSVFQVNANVSINADVQCYGDNDGSATVTGSGGIAPYSYLWNNSQNGTTINNLSPGTYYVTVTDSLGCKGIATAIINGPTSPINLNSYLSNVTCENLCDGMIGTNVTGGTNPYTYLWSTNPTQTTSVINNLCSGPYLLTVTDFNGCIVTDSIFIPFNTAINASFTSDITFGYIPMTVNFTFTGTGAYTYNWDFGDGITSTLQNPSHIYTTTGIYQVVLTIYGPNSCTSTYTITIVVEDVSFLEVPNVFTPNNDGLNDYFEIKYNYIGEFLLKIFNRWGNLIYISNDVTVQWDGRNKSGLLVPEGTYFYIIEAKGKDRVIYTLNGSISLLK